MTHKDTGWRPDAGVESYKGYEIWEYESGPHEINDGTVDGDIEFAQELKDRVLGRDEDGDE